MIKIIDFRNSRLVQDLFQLQREAYLVEAVLINNFEIPPLKESLEDFKNCNETFLGFFEGKELVGALSYEVADQVLTICRLVVHPKHFRKGIAKSLLSELDDRQREIAVLRVSTGRENEPAKTLYLKNGFRLKSDTEVIPGLFISNFEKRGNQV